MHKATIHDPTNKSEPKHIRIEGTSRVQKSNENNLKKTQKSHELQARNRRNHESFHSLGGLILYKMEEKSNLWSKGMRSSPEGWFAWKP
jgi:hypothetical protein